MNVALQAFEKSCAVLSKKSPSEELGIAGPVVDWQKACALSAAVQPTDEASRHFFETNFVPYGIVSSRGEDGLFTGYFVPRLSGSLARTMEFRTPLYKRPADLVSVDLGVFKSELKGQHVVGKLNARNLVPYDTRKEIDAGSLSDRAEVLVWVDDPVEAFFLEVQGSGIIDLPDGRSMTVGYDGANGKAYVSLGRLLLEKGELAKPVTMSSIRAWLSDHPDLVSSTLEENSSYVFFRELPNEEVLGAEGVALTAGRSLAVDPAYIPLGVPLWLSSSDGNGEPIRRLMVAQDIGGAIKGPLRGDYFWGAGDVAAVQAGAMQSAGKLFILVPKER